MNKVSKCIIEQRKTCINPGPLPPFAWNKVKNKTTSANKIRAHTFIHENNILQTILYSVWTKTWLQCNILTVRDIHVS